MSEERSFNYDERTKELTITAHRVEVFKADDLRKQYESLVNTRTNLDKQSSSLKKQIEEIKDEETEEVKKFRELKRVSNNLDMKEQLIAKKKQVDETLEAYRKDIHFLKPVMEKIPKK